MIQHIFHIENKLASNAGKLCFINRYLFNISTNLLSLASSRCVSNNSNYSFFFINIVLKQILKK